jgi:hypothetical protein
MTIDLIVVAFIIFYGIAWFGANEVENTMWRRGRKKKK